MFFSSSRAALAWPVLFVIFGVSVSTNRAEAQSLTPQQQQCEADAVGTVSEEMRSTLQTPPTNKNPGDAALSYAKQWKEKVRACGGTPIPETAVCSYAVLHAVTTLYQKVAAAPDKPLGVGDLTQQALAFDDDIRLCVKPVRNTCEDIDKAAIFDVRAWIRDNPTGDFTPVLQQLTQNANTACAELIQMTICDIKQAVLPRFIEDYYGLLPPKPQELTIAAAVYGDLKHGHVCDATAYFRYVCELMKKTPSANKGGTQPGGTGVIGAAPSGGADGAAPGGADGKGAADTDSTTDDGSPSAGPTFCRLRRQSPDGTDFCGYDPSQQAESKYVFVRYWCGPIERKLTLPGETKKINLVCGGAPFIQRPRPSDESLAKQLTFLTAAPCPIDLPPKKP
jgi:hypothetical protein